jgi:hypothetical protein
MIHAVCLDPKDRSGVKVPTGLISIFRATLRIAINNTVGTIPGFHSSEPTDTAGVDTAIQASDGGAQNKEPLVLPDDSHGKGPVGQSDSRHTEPLFSNETVAGVKVPCLFCNPGF